MVEPTESESKAELDRFCDAMLAIHVEAMDIAAGRADAHNNPLKNAPHTQAMLVAEEWSLPYSRQQAGYPMADSLENKCVACGASRRRRLRRPQFGLHVCPHRILPILIFESISVVSLKFFNANHVNYMKKSTLFLGALLLSERCLCATKPSDFGQRAYGGRGTCSAC